MRIKGLQNEKKQITTSHLNKDCKNTKVKADNSLSSNKTPEFLVSSFLKSNSWLSSL